MPRTWRHCVARGSSPQTTRSFDHHAEAAVIVEVHAAEGGEDARDLVREQVMIYLRRCAKHELKMEILDDRESVVTLRVTGPRADELFKDEGGGHRWQRVPPNERRGRGHTSTITVAVLSERLGTGLIVKESDLEWKAVRGSGSGGQARNKTSNCVQLWHKPSGLMVRCESERSQDQNLASAKLIIMAKLALKFEQEIDEKMGGQRRAQLGSGMRGDKRRTVRVQDGQVNDHVTGRKWRYKDYVRGDW